MPPPPDALAARLSAARNGIRPVSLDALLVTNPVNLRYLTGVAASAGMALLSAEGVVVVVDQRYLQQFQDAAAVTWAAGPLSAVPIGQSYEATAAAVVASREVRTLGNRGRPPDGGPAWRPCGPRPMSRPGGMRETSGFIERFRAIKDPWELGRLREAGGRLAEVAACILPEVSEGRTEREVSWKVELALHDAGFERPAFETIVASRPNAARPHHRPTERRIATRGAGGGGFRRGARRLRRGHDPHRWPSGHVPARPNVPGSARLPRLSRRRSPPPSGRPAVGHRWRGARRRWRGTVSPTPSSTAPGTVWGWTCTNGP